MFDLKPYYEKGNATRWSPWFLKAGLSPLTQSQDVCCSLVGDGECADAWAFAVCCSPEMAV